MTSPTPPPGSWWRASQVFLAIVLTVAITGFFVGLQETRRSQNIPALAKRGNGAGVEISKPKDVPWAAAYQDLARTKLGPNRTWESSLAMLTQTPLPPPEKPAADADVALALRERANRRAFDGAPPVIPHPTSGQEGAACLACHQHGIRIGDRLAAKMSHPLYASCTQCHIEVAEATNGPIGNSFAGLEAPLRGDRAFPGAPPTIPHPLALRTDCLSCHGPHGIPALRTTHPERQSCLQCHAPSSLLEHVPVSESRP